MNVFESIANSQKFENLESRMQQIQHSISGLGISALQSQLQRLKNEIGQLKTVSEKVEETQ